MEDVIIKETMQNFLKHIKNNEKVIWIKTNDKMENQVSKIDIDEGVEIDYKLMQSWVGGLFQQIHTYQKTFWSDKYSLYCGEESAIKGLPINPMATILANTSHTIAGDCFLIRKDLEN